MTIQVINRSPHPLPQYQTEASAGMDIRAWLPEAVTLQPLERKLIPTGLYISLPIGFEAQLRPRSGMAFKNGITLINTPGTIDADYRGEVMLPVVNLSNEAFTLNDGDRIAQMVIARHEQAAWHEVAVLEESTRGCRWLWPYGGWLISCFVDWLIGRLVSVLSQLSLINKLTK